MTKEKLKIGFVRRGFSASGGAEVYLQRLAQGVVSRGHTVQLFSTPDWQTEAWPFGELTRLDSGSPMGFAAALERAARKSDCDVLMSLERVRRCDVYRAGDGVHRAWLERRAKVLTPWSKLATRFNRKHASILKLEEVLLGGRGAHFVIANSEMVKRELIKFYDYPADRITVIYNGVPVTDLALAAGMRSKSRAALGLGPSDLALLFVGSGWERKGLRFAIQAMEAAGLPKCRLLVAGRGNQRAFQANNVHFLGPVSDLPSLYAASDIFLLPTLYDPFSNACLEALAWGLPVITTNANGFSEIIDDRVHGSVIEEPTDVGALSQAIQRWSEQDVRTKSRAAIMERAAQFDISKNVELTLKLLLQVPARAALVSGKMRKT